MLVVETFCNSNTYLLQANGGECISFLRRSQSDLDLSQPSKSLCSDHGSEMLTEHVCVIPSSSPASLSDYGRIRKFFSNRPSHGPSMQDCTLLYTRYASVHIARQLRSYSLRRAFEDRHTALLHILNTLKPAAPEMTRLTGRFQYNCRPHSWLVYHDSGLPFFHA